MSDHNLDAAALAARFDRRIRPDLDALITEQQATSGQPAVVFVGAQPAAGKTRANAHAMQDDPRLVPVIGDDLRSYHPDYTALMRETPLAMPEATAQASGQWIGMSNAYLRSQGACALVETTLRVQGVLLGELQAFKDAGYTTELRVLAVPPEVSRASTLMRYAADASQHDAGRWTPSSSHDDAVAAGPTTLHATITSGLLDHVTVHNRSGQTLYRATITAQNRGEVADAAVHALTAGRDVTTLATRDAVDWLEKTRQAIAHCTDAGESNPDVIGVIRQIAEHDAPAIAAAAYPGDPARADAAHEVIENQMALMQMRELHAKHGPVRGAPAAHTHTPSALHKRNRIHGAGLDGTGLDGGELEY